MAQECYVVRIYRREGEPQEIVGIVEDPEDGRQIGFRSVAELSAILVSPRRHFRHVKRGGGPPRPDM